MDKKILDVCCGSKMFWFDRDNPNACIECAKEHEQLAEWLEELQQYRAIGTAEECREAMERQRAKKPVEYEDKYYGCPSCDNILMHKWERYPFQMKDRKNGLPYCLSCGQAIDWSDMAADSR